MKIKALSFGLSRRARLLLAILAGMAALYAALGFLVLPAVVKARLPRVLGSALGRPASVQRVRINPFTFAASLEGFRVADGAGGPWIGFDRLRLRLRPWALAARTVSLAELELLRPYGKVALLKDGQLDCADVLRRFQGAPAPAPKGRPWVFAVTRLAVLEARVDLEDHSLAEPFATRLGPLTLVLDGFRTDPGRRTPGTCSGRTESGERFSWSGSFSLDPLRSEGRIQVERLALPKYHPYYQDRVRFILRRGLASAAVSYQFRWAPGDHVLKLEDGRAALQDLQLASSGQGEPEVRLPALEARGFQADLLARTAAVASLRLADGRLEVVREPDGEINLVRLLTPRPPARPEPPSRPFHLALGELAVQRFAVAFRDLAAVRPVRAVAEPVDATLRDFSLEPAQAARLELALRLNGKAAVTASGTVLPLKPAVDLKVAVDRLDLAPFDPYLAPATDVRLTGGTLAAAGRLRGDFQARPGGAAGPGPAIPSASFQGDFTVTGFEAMDGAQREPFLRYRSFRVAGLDLRTRPPALAVRRVDLAGPEARLVVSADGSTNVARALKLASAPGGQAGGRAGAVAGAALPPTQGRAFRLNVGTVALRDGRLSFIDRSLEPNAALLLSGLEGAYTRLSTDPDTASTVDVRGLAGGIAPVRIQGRAMVLRQDRDTDVTLVIQGSELSDFSPYAGKYLGYTIRKGKLGVDARIRIQERKLDSLFNTRLDQFYLGERTQSPDATHLPVKLALAVLRDRHGVIDLELPVQGSLDDPDFRYGRIVWHAVLNVLGKVAASPFTLLGKLFGGGDHDLSYVTFAPGGVEPDPDTEAKVQALARALDARPALSLEAEGSADPNVDGAALRRRALDRRLRELRDAGAAAAPAPLSPEERQRWLPVAYRAAFPPAPGAPSVQPPPPAEMEQRLLESFPVAAGDLRQLADARAKALLRLLLEAKADPARLFQVEGGERARQEGGNRVYLGLR
jgi:hypothetical protein